jgi:hypothetical protein
MLKYEIEKKYQLKKIELIKLIHQTHDMGHEIFIIIKKINCNKS